MDDPVARQERFGTGVELREPALELVHLEELGGRRAGAAADAGDVGRYVNDDGQIWTEGADVELPDPRKRAGPEKAATARSARGPASDVASSGVWSSGSARAT